MCSFAVNKDTATNTFTANTIPSAYLPFVLSCLKVHEKTQPMSTKHLITPLKVSKNIAVP